MSVTIINGDMRDALASIPDGSVDCILTDPPYGETSLQWDQRVPNWPALVRRVLKPSGSMWVFGSFRMFIGGMKALGIQNWTASLASKLQVDPDDFTPHPAIIDLADELVELAAA